MSVDDVVRGMGLMQERLIRNRYNPRYRETVEHLYEEHVSWFFEQGEADRALEYGSWLEVYRRVFPLGDV